NSAVAADQACAIINGGFTPGGGQPLFAYLANQTGQANEGCNVLITFNANGSITTTNPNAALSYDSSGDDNLVGIINNTGQALTSVALFNAAVPIFSLDGDGVCDPTWTFASGGPTFTCPASGGYAPTGVSFSITNDNAGVVNFSGGGIAAKGGTGFFSL